MGRLCAAAARGGCRGREGEVEGSPAQTHQKQILCVTASLNLATAHDTTLIQPHQWTRDQRSISTFRSNVSGNQFDVKCTTEEFVSNSPGSLASVMDVWTMAREKIIPLLISTFFCHQHGTSTSTSHRPIYGVTVC